MSIESTRIGNAQINRSIFDLWIEAENHFNRDAKFVSNDFPETNLRCALGANEYGVNYTLLGMGTTRAVSWFMEDGKIIREEMVG
jgi:hypothetical protein